MNFSLWNYFMKAHTFSCKSYYTCQIKYKELWMYSFKRIKRRKFISLLCKFGNSEKLSQLADKCFGASFPSMGGSAAWLLSCHSSWLMPHPSFYSLLMCISLCLYHLLDLLFILGIVNFIFVIIWSSIFCTKFIRLTLSFSCITFYILFFVMRNACHILIQKNSELLVYAKDSTLFFPFKVNIFRGITLPDAPKFGKVFGGQFIGQARLSCSLSLSPIGMFCKTSFQ